MRAQTGWKATVKYIRGRNMSTMSSLSLLLVDRNGLHANFSPSTFAFVPVAFHLLGSQARSPWAYKSTNFHLRLSAMNNICPEALNSHCTVKIINVWVHISHELIEVCQGSGLVPMRAQMGWRAKVKAKAKHISGRYMFMNFLNVIYLF